MSERDKNKIKMATWRRENPEKAKVAYRVVDFRKKFGMEISDYEMLLRKQKGVCAICGNAETALSNRGTIRRLSVDHCHSTGIVRGLLCYRCNYVLGLCKDNVTTLRGGRDDLELDQECDLH